MRQQLRVVMKDESKASYGQSQIGGNSKQVQLINEYVVDQNADTSKMAKKFSNASSSKPSVSHTRGSSMHHAQAVGITVPNTGGHEKTKSAMLASQLVNNLPETTQNLPAGAITQQLITQNSKLVSKHIRHVSGPTVNGALYPPSFAISRDPSKQQKRVVQIQPSNISMTDQSQITINMLHNPNVQVSSQVKQAIQINHARANTNKIIVTNNDLTKGGNESYQDYTDLTQNTNQSNLSASQNAGHKKSVSMANSKITQLLLKAGYNQVMPAKAQLQQQAAIKQLDKTKPKSSKTKVKGQTEMIKSMEVAREQTREGNIGSELNQLHHVGITTAIQEFSDEQIQKILTFDERDLSSLSGFHDIEMMRLNSEGQPGILKSDFFDKSGKASAPTKQPTSFINQHKVNAQQLNAAQGSKSRTGEMYGTDKIKNQAKIVTSVTAIKQPNVVKTSFNNSIAQVHEQQLVNQSATLEERKSLNGNHQRTKSDQLSVQKVMANLSGNIIQKQQKKVGEILRSNILDSQSIVGSNDSIKGGLQNIVSNNTTSVHSKQVQSFAVHEQSSLTSQTQGSQPIKKTKPRDSKQQLHSEIVQSVPNKQSRKSTREKYNELKQQYDDLAEKYYQAIAAAQQSNTQAPSSKMGIVSNPSSLSNQTLSSINASGLSQLQPQVLKSYINQQPHIRIESELETRVDMSQDSGLDSIKQNMLRESQKSNSTSQTQQKPSQVQRRSEHIKVAAPASAIVSGLVTGAGTGGSGPQKHKVQSFMVRLDNNKVLLSSREHEHEEVGQPLNKGIIKQRVVSAARKDESVRKTPECLEQQDQEQMVDSQTKQAGEPVITKQKLELSKRHRRSFSDGNDLLQFKFNQATQNQAQAQNQVQTSNFINNSQQHKQTIIHQIVGLDQASKSDLRFETSISTINPPPSAQQLRPLIPVEKDLQSRTKCQPQATVAQTLNTLRAQHTRLKSDDMQTKKRVKSNSIYMINQQKQDLNPTNEGNIKSPHLDMQVRGFLSDLKNGQQVIRQEPPVMVDKVNRHRVIHKTQVSVGQNNAKQLVYQDQTKSQFESQDNTRNSQSPRQNSSCNPRLSESQINWANVKVARSENPSNSHNNQKKEFLSQTAEPSYGLQQPHMNNLFNGGKTVQIKESDFRPVSHSTTRTAYSHESDQKGNGINQVNSRGIYVSDNKESHKQPHQMILKGNMQALVAQQPKNNQITHHQKNNLSASFTSNSKKFLNTVKIENIEGHKLQALGEPANVQSQLYKKTEDSVVQNKRRLMTTESKHSSHHKRVKSDAVEQRQDKLLTIVRPQNNLPSVSYKNLPVKAQNAYEHLDTSPKIIPKGDVAFSVLNINQNRENFFLGVNSLDGTSDDHKLVNVSIDLKDEDGQGSDLAGDDLQNNAQLQGGQWYEVKQDYKPSLAAEQLLMQVNQARITKHRRAEDVIVSIQVDRRSNKSTGKATAPSKSEERVSQNIELRSNGDVARLEKYKQMLKKTKIKNQSKSEVPQSIVIQEDFCLNEDISGMFFANRQTQQPNKSQHANEVRNSKHKQSQNNDGIVRIEDESEENVDVKINMVIPQNCEAKLAQANNMRIEEHIQHKQKPDFRQDAFVPANSMANSLSAHTDKLSNSLAALRSPDNQIVDDHLQTQDSIANDPTLSPREKIVKKLTKYISRSYNRGIESCPPSTIDFYRIGKVLGKGAFGKVNLALHQLTKRMVAIKSINKSYFNEEQQSTKVKQEVVILKQTRHRNIVKLYEYFETQKHILLVTEICAGGDLLNYVRKRRQLKEDVAKSVFKQIIEGIGYCHSKNILHRDIKLDNILLAWNGEIKIGDFGVSKVVKRGEVMNEQCGTPAYIAPEILVDRGYTGFSADMWSAGVVLYAMLYGTVPFKATNMSELQKLIIKAQYTLQDCISKEARNLLEGLLEKDPQKRLNITQVLKHAWMKDAKDTVELFTSAEQNYIKNEYTYANTDRYNRNEPDNFMDGALDTEQNTELKNADTKSIILAPFNSTKSHIESSKSFLSEIRDMMQSRSCIYFVGKVREIDKQYEVNNNADLDNGVYHDFGKEDENAIKQLKAGQNVSPNKQSELEKLESMIKHQESVNNNEKDSDEQPYECGDEEGIPNTRILQPSNSKKLMTKEQLLSSSINAAEIKKVLAQANTLAIDTSIVDQVTTFGYRGEAVIRYLNNNELNSATTCYFLLQQPDIRAECQKIEQMKEQMKASASSGSLGSRLV